MATHKEISDALIALLKRRPGVFGKWIPTIYWISRMKMDKLDNGRLQKALETSGTLMTRIEDSAHGYLYIEITKKKLPYLGTKWFICCSTAEVPNPYVGNFDKILYGKVLQASWDRWTQEEENTALLETEERSPAQPTPPQVSLPIVSPTVSPSPEQIREDSHLLDFFRGTIRTECSTKENLFCDGVSNGSLGAKIASFGRTLAAKDQTELIDKFYDSTAPVSFKNKDITKLAPDPCLSKKYGIPMHVQAMREIVTAILELAKDPRYYNSRNKVVPKDTERGLSP